MPAVEDIRRAVSSLCLNTGDRRRIFGSTLSALNQHQSATQKSAIPPLWQRRELNPRLLLRSATFRTVLTNATILLLGMGSSVQLSRWLGPTGRGQIAAAMLWPMLLTYIMSMGLISAIMYYAAQPETPIQELMANAAGCALVQGTLGIVAGYFIMPWVLHSQSTVVVHISRWYLSVIPVSLLTQYGCSVLQGKLHFAAFNTSRLVIPVGYVLGVLLLKMHGTLTFSRAVMLHLFLNVAALALTLIIILTLHLPIGLRTDWTLARRMLRYGAQVQAGDLSSAANLRLDQVLMSAWMPPAMLGLYVVAVSASGLSDVIALAWRIVATPAIARQGAIAERRLTLQKTFRRYLLISSPLTCLLALALPVLIPAFFGRAFRDSIVPAEVLLVGAVFLSAKNVLGGGLQALGSPWLGSRADILALIVTVVALPPLLLRYHILGAAIASTLAYATQLCIVLYGLHHVHSISPRSLLVSETVKVRNS